TLVLNDINLIIHPIGDLYERGADNPVVGISLFQLMGEHLVLAKSIGIVILLFVISGWRPRITGIFHWWITFSLAVSGITIDGGDQIASLLTFLLIPVCLADSRRSHWINQPREYNSTQKHLNLVAFISFLVIKFQVAAIYFQAAVSKMNSDEWLNGTSLYYWSKTPLFMMPDWLEPIMNPLLTNAFTLSLLTWGVLAFELLLFAGLVIGKKWRIPLMIGGILFHFGIVLLYGLVSFFFAMSAALILYLRPLDRGIQLKFGFRKRGRYTQKPSTINLPPIITT
ncbi:MAG: sporulation-delaying protein SdpB family protein, partial [Bacteroidota bacterium]